MARAAHGQRADDNGGSARDRGPLERAGDDGKAWVRVQDGQDGHVIKVLYGGGKRWCNDSWREVGAWLHGLGVARPQAARQGHLAPLPCSFACSFGTDLCLAPLLARPTRCVALPRLSLRL
jgi:hypothetical protein